jgi:hypothetical protein
MDWLRREKAEGAAIWANTDPQFEEKASDVIGLYLKSPLNAGKGLLQRGFQIAWLAGSRRGIDQELVAKAEVGVAPA